MDIAFRPYEQQQLRGGWFIPALKSEGIRPLCPVCSAASGMKGCAGERYWQNLDALRIQPTLISAIPGCSCKGCGVKAISVPGAERHNRLPLRDGDFARDVRWMLKAGLKKDADMVVFTDQQRTRRQIQHVNQIDRGGCRGCAAEP